MPTKKEVLMVAATLPAVWSTGIPALPALVGSAPTAMIVLLGLLCISAVALLRTGRRRIGIVSPPGSLAGVGLDAYRRFLARRDGLPNLERHTLSRREALFAALDAAPVRSCRAIDRDAYRRNLVRRRPERGLDAPLLWLLASAKANQAERFGVGLAELYGRVPACDEDPVRVHMHLQETYHTRILCDAVALFGLHVQPNRPPLCTRALIKLIVLLPPQWTLPLVGCSEMIGCVIFRALRDRGLALFADEPAVAERIRVLYDEILADELSHVGFVAAHLGPRGRRLMCWLYRHTATGMVAQMPELGALFGRGELRRRFRSFRLATMVAEFPDTAYAAALV
jgi:hypothetical protein